MNPGGIRLGSPAMTTRGLDENDFKNVADFVHRGVNIALQVQKDAGMLHYPLSIDLYMIITSRRYWF